MKQLPRILLITTALTLSACGQAGEQWMNPDKSFALFEQPDVHSVNETQEKMAKEAFAAEDYARAVQYYEQLIGAGKGTPAQQFSYKLAMADSVRRLGDSAAALPMYDELHRLQPANVEVMEGRALAMMGAGKTEDAGRAFSEVMEKDQKRWRTLNALGILFVTKNMVPEAMQYYTAALDLSPDNAAILNNVGLSYAVDRNFPRAITALEQAARVSKTKPQRKQIEMNLAMIHGVSGDMEAARSVASKYYEGPALDNNLGLYAHLAKDNVLAKTYLNMALSQNPTFYERAWENLDAIAGEGRGDEPQNAGVKKKATKPLPKLEAVATPPAKAGRQAIASDEKLPEKKAVMPIKPTSKLDVKQDKRSPEKMAENVKPATAEKSLVKDTLSDASTDEKPALPSDKKPALSNDKNPELSSDSGPDRKHDSDAALPSDKAVVLPSDKGKSEDKPSDLIVGPSEGD